MAEQRVLLLGCVKQKRQGVHPARDLYRSPLWRARWAYAESAGAKWFIVSAAYGLVEPEQLIASYDLALRDLTAADRRAWGQAVVAALESRVGSLAGITIELHAGEAYRRALAPSLEARDGTVVAPTASIPGIGAQIAWYRARSRRQWATEEEFTRALHDLDVAPELIQAAEWPGSRLDLDQPGLYSWWVDEAGAHALSRGLAITIAPGRIYAGLTGATKWPSGTTGRHTLRLRIGNNHIRGRIRGSTFRLTLAAILCEQLGLGKTGSKTLDPESEAILSDWIRSHLSVAVHPFASSDALADLERRVLAVLDPPLNLNEMAPTRIRQRLKALRGRVSATMNETLLFAQIRPSTGIADRNPTPASAEPLRAPKFREQRERRRARKMQRTQGSRGPDGLGRVPSEPRRPPRRS